VTPSPVARSIRTRPEVGSPPQYGRRYVVPAGFFLASICALLLATRSAPLMSALIVTALSVGFDATHPLMSSITTSLDPKHRGQITGLATFANFVGMATGALVFRRLMVPHFSTALVCLACAEFGFGPRSLRFSCGGPSYGIARERQFGATAHKSPLSSPALGVDYIIGVRLLIPLRQSSLPAHPRLQQLCRQASF
jgi:MFS family permease